MTKFLARFMNDESGATAIEYGLVAALISISIITGATSIGNQLSNLFSNVANELQTATM
jgi:pilus assembly protein Flp/PilA